MYHTKIHAYVVIEVKMDEISPSDFGQLNFYINAVNDLEKTEYDNDTVGILLCKNADSYIVKTSVSGMKNQIGVSKYKLLEDIPLYLTTKLKELDDEDNYKNDDMENHYYFSSGKKNPYASKLKNK